MRTLKIGDEVIWRGSWGKDAPKRAKVEAIEITGGGKYGDSVDEVEWSKVCDRNITVVLDNGHWAYASQISPV
jgi:primase-polymerase (primpol)-like protein